MKVNFFRFFVGMFAVFSAQVASAVVVSGRGTWETTLQARDLDGNAATAEAYYDTTLNITWLATTNLFTGTWSESRTWVSRLNIGGVTGWRLPDVKPVNGTSFTYNLGGFGESDYGYNVSSTQSELGHMFHVTLGNEPFQTGEFIRNTGPFVVRNFGSQSTDLGTFYWTRVTYAPDTSKAWIFDIPNGLQGGLTKESVFVDAWAVHTGDVGVAIAVPEPSTWALMLIGLGALVGVARSKSRQS